MGLHTLVDDLLSKTLKDYPSLFVIDFTISSNNNIVITLDGDEAVKLQDCIDISKAIDSEIDDEEYDFSLEVASCGAEAPIKQLRQLKKHIGRTVGVKFENKEWDAKLIDVKEEAIALEWKTREPKKIGKGKETVQYNEELPFDSITEIKVKITFN